MVQMLPHAKCQPKWTSGLKGLSFLSGRCHDPLGLTHIDTNTHEMSNLRERLSASQNSHQDDKSFQTSTHMSHRFSCPFYLLWPLGLWRPQYNENGQLNLFDMWVLIRKLLSSWCGFWGPNWRSRKLLISCVFVSMCSVCENLRWDQFLLFWLRSIQMRQNNASK